MAHVSASRSARTLAPAPRACLRLVTEGGAEPSSRAEAIHCLQVHSPVLGTTTLFRTWATADVEANGCGRCRTCTAVHYGDGVSACGLILAGPSVPAAEALDYAPGGA